MVSGCKISALTNVSCDSYLRNGNYLDTLDFRGRPSLKFSNLFFCFVVIDRRILFMAGQLSCISDFLHGDINHYIGQ